uniref:ESX-1 secretion-associated protein EspA/EspE-like domain-containing protein n=2 Tax=unclassified Mycobacterium TaxID=2642494 RepID=A0A5Q5BTF8_MYCSS
MDGVRWYLKGLAQQPAPPLAPMFTVPEVTAIEGPLARVQLAAQRYHLTASSALSDENVTLIRAWGERQKRILAWLQVLDAGDDLDSAAAALSAVPAVGGAMWGHSATTVFDELQELASAEARVHTDYANLQRAIAFYMAAVDGAVNQAAVQLDTFNTAAEKRQYADSAITAIEHYTRRIDAIRQAPAGSGNRPAA